MRYDRIIVIFVLLLVVFTGFVLGQKIVSSMGKADLSKRIEAIEAENAAIKLRIDTLEKSGRSRNGGAGQSAGRASGRSLYETEYINKDNIDSRVTWSQTNWPNVFVVTVELASQPEESSMLVWTGMGLLPVHAFKLNGKVLTVIIQQNKNEFIANNNFINIRYQPK